MGTTMRDVAMACKVSIATVSRVLNNPLSVADETRVKIEKAISELGYRHAFVAQKNISTSLRTIGLILPDINNVYYPAVIRGIEDELAKNNYSLFICNSDENIDKEKAYIATLIKKRVDGVMFLGTRDAQVSQDHIIRLSTDFPVLLINDHIIGSNVYSIMADEVEGSYRAVRYLIELGHRRIAYVRGDGDYTTYRYKYEGYEKALHDANIEISGDFIVSVDPHERGGYDAGSKMLALQNTPTAIFAANDQLAIGIMKAVYEAGLTIPKDISLVGFSDIPIAAELYPPLTTVNQFPYRTGVIAAQTIVKVINKEEMTQRRIILEPKLSIRKSCKAIEAVNSRETLLVNVVVRSSANESSSL